MKIKVIVGSTRPNRFSEKPAAWIFEMLKKKEGIEAELLDLRDYPLPFFDEPASPSTRKGYSENPVAAQWEKKIDEADGFVIVTPEYNHGYSAVLKNALDFPYREWNNKAVCFVSYGSVGGARSVEQLREVAVELQMTPVRAAVHIPSPWNMLDEKGELKAGSLDPFSSTAENMLTQLAWWVNALKKAREAKMPK